MLERDPVEHYARLMLGRTLERQGRGSEAAGHLRMAAALSGDFEPTPGRTAPRGLPPGEPGTSSTPGKIPTGFLSARAGRSTGGPAIPSGERPRPR